MVYSSSQVDSDFLTPSNSSVHARRRQPADTVTHQHVSRLANVASGRIVMTVAVMKPLAVNIHAFVSKEILLD